MILRDGPSFKPICLINVSVVRRRRALPSISYEDKCKEFYLNVLMNTSWRKREARLSNDGSIPRTNDATSLGVNRSGRDDDGPISTT
jgi:hypothetical protein